MTAFWSRGAFLKRLGVRGLVFTAASGLGFLSNRPARLEQADPQTPRPQTDSGHLVRDVPVLRAGTYVGNHRDMKSGDWKKVDFPQGSIYIFKASEKLVLGFGQFSPVTWEPWESPIIVGNKLYCDKTFFEFDLTSGYSQFCLDQVPTYRLTLSPDGSLHTETDAALVPSEVSFLPSSLESQEESPNIVLVGWNEASAKMALQGGSRSILKGPRESWRYSRRKNVALHSAMTPAQLDELFLRKAGFQVFEYDEGFLRKRDRSGEWVNDFEVVFRVSGLKRRLKAAYILPSNARPGPPKEFVEAGVDASRLVLSRDDPRAALGSRPGSRVLHLQADSLESLGAAVDCAGNFEAVVVYSDYFWDRLLLAQWVQRKARTRFSFRPRKEFLGAYRAESSDRSATFASDSFDSQFYAWASKSMGLETPSENRLNLTCNFSGACVFPIGLGSVYRIPGFPSHRTAFLDSEGVQQATVIDGNIHLGDNKLAVQPIDSARIDNKLIASIGDFRDCQVLHQEGDVAQDSFLELCLDRIGLLRGARAAGRENLEKLAYLHQACTHHLLPRYARYWESPDLVPYLETAVKKTLKRRMMSVLKKRGLDD